jgi:secreted trypsin-like serine protease
MIARRRALRWGGEHRGAGSSRFARGSRPGPQNPRDRLVCSGRLVAPDVVLSAGHCTEIFLFGLALQAQTGSRNLGGLNAKVTRVKSAVLNKKWWFGSQSFDVALFKLEKTVGTAKSTLARSTDTPLTKAGNQVQLAGWGLMTKLAVFEEPPFDARPPRRAQVVTAPIVSDAACVTAYEDLDPTIVVPATDICAGAEGKDVCYGDSGGPMFATDPKRGSVQIGVTSRGGGCATKSFPGIWTDVTKLRGWIDRNINAPCTRQLDPALAIPIYLC